MAELDELRKQAAQAMTEAAKSAIVGQDEAAKSQRKRWLAIAGIVGGGIGLLLLWGLLSRIGTFLIGLGFCTAVAGGGYYLLRGKYQAWQQKKLVDNTDKQAPQRRLDTEAELEAQLAELKRKAR